jgi:hypothetical protein
MKRVLILSLALGAMISLGGCTGYYGGAGVGYGYNDYDDLYYDNYYGPVRDGYWSNDGWYYYRDRTTRKYRRDDGRHFGAMRRTAIIRRGCTADAITITAGATTGIVIKVTTESAFNLFAIGACVVRQLAA